MPKFNQNQIEAIKRATELLNEKIKSNDKQDGVMVSNERIQKFVQEKQGIDEFAAEKNPLIKEYINLHKEAEKRPYTKIGRMKKSRKMVKLYGNDHSIFCNYHIINNFILYCVTGNKRRCFAQ